MSPQPRRIPINPPRAIRASVVRAAHDQWVCRLVLGRGLVAISGHDTQDEAWAEAKLAMGEAA